ncbi:MAG: alpha/beta fold hydrolase [Acidimicrobiales bacterium]|nr:alpha/beta fold hydrolase [Acidimicrobiales bacterium]
MSAAVLTTADGVRLRARWWRPRGDGAAGEAVVVVHGFCSRQDAPEVELIAIRQSAAGRRVLTFDLRGHGHSEGHTTMGHLERLDVGAAVAAASCDHDVVVVVGASMGGVATIGHLAAGGAPSGPVADGAVVVGTPAWWQVPRSPRGVLAMALTQTRPGRHVAARRMGTRVAVRTVRGAAPVEQIRSVARPVAVVHGLADRYVSPASASALYAAAAEPRRLDLVPGMGHAFCPAAVESIDAGVDWVVDHRRISGERRSGSDRA